MRGVILAAVVSALLSFVGPPAAFAVGRPALQLAVVDEAGASGVGRPVAPLPEAAPPVPASPAEAGKSSVTSVGRAPARHAPPGAGAGPAGALDFVWLLPLGSGLTALGVGVVLSRRHHDDSD